MAFITKSLTGNDVRVPDPRPGEAAVISRYGRQRAIMLHPADFQRLSEIEQLVNDAVALEPLVFTDEAIRAHAEEGTPGEQPVTDPDRLAELFG